MATNDTYYIQREDWKAHEILVNIQSGEPCEIWERDSLGNPKNRIPNPKEKFILLMNFIVKHQSKCSLYLQMLQKLLAIQKK